MKFIRLLSAIRSYLEERSQGTFRVLRGSQAIASAESFVGNQKGVYVFIGKMDGGEVDKQDNTSFESRVFVKYLMFCAEKQDTVISDVVSAETDSERAKAISKLTSGEKAHESLLTFTDSIYTLITSALCKDFDIAKDYLDEQVNIVYKSVPKTEFFEPIYESSVSLESAVITQMITITEERETATIDWIANAESEEGPGISGSYEDNEGINILDIFVQKEE